MAANRGGKVTIVDPSGSGGPGGAGRYVFTLMPTGKGGRGYTTETRPWQPGDLRARWRIPCHPWDEGLFVDRLRPNPHSYAKANADSTNAGMLLHPPKLNSVTMTNGNAPSKFVAFNSLIFVVGGRYMYYFNPADNTVTEDKDFGSGKAAVDACVFNNELIVAMGETEKIYKRTTSGTWTQATDATYAIALGVVGPRLWRAESTNKLSSATTTPLTLANWTPASPNQYTVGDSTYAVHTIIDFGGIPWALKGDGAYAPDTQTFFKNQAPQLARYPHSNNAKGAFVAQASLWIPSASGLLRIRPGSSKIRGPEITFRPSYRFWVRGGVEWGDYIYLLVNDEAASGNTAILKMEVNKGGYGGREYLFHEWCQLDGTTATGRAITITSVGTNPELVCAYGNDLRYITLGRGGGRDIDDANYTFGTSMTCETGRMRPPLGDISVVSVPVGVDVVHKLISNCSLTIAGAVDGNAYANLLDEAESGGGTAAISSTTDYQTSTRYFPVNTVGQFIEVKFTSTLASGTMSGTTRSEILEAWVFGYSRPKVTDTISLAIQADGSVTFNGIRQGLSQSDIERLFRNWMNVSTNSVLTVELEGYEDGRTTRFVVTDVRINEATATTGTGGTLATTSIVQVELQRADFASAFASS